MPVSKLLPAELQREGAPHRPSPREAEYTSAVHRGPAAAVDPATGTASAKVTEGAASGAAQDENPLAEPEHDLELSAVYPDANRRASGTFT